MSGETRAQLQLTSTPYYSQVDQYNRGEQKLESGYDKVSRDDNKWHGKSTTAKQPYLETSLYSIIQQEESVRPAAAKDVNTESNSSVYSLLQAEGTSNSLDVNCKSKFENIDTRAKLSWVLLILTIACFAILLLLFIVVATVIFSQLSIIKSQYTSLQKSMHDNTSFIQPSSKPEARQNIPPTTSSCCSNFSSLQTMLLDTKSNLNTLMLGINMTWGLNYSIVNDIYLADNSFNCVVDTITKLGTSAKYPASSCGNILAIKPASPSGMYWLKVSDGSSVSVFCDMNWTCDGVGRGWIKVGGFNVNKKCPENFRLENNIGNGYSGSICLPMSSQDGCTSIKYFTSNISYSRVCGEVKGIGIDTPDGFRNFNNFFSRTDQIDQNYVDGISITHGMPLRKHIWSFVAANGNGDSICSCNSEKPSFVKDNLSCMEVVNTNARNGCGCEGCQTIFYTTLTQATMDVIEIRVCTDQGNIDEQVGIRFAEIYIQ